MTLLALLLFAVTASPARLSLIDEVVSVPAGQVEALSVALRQKPAVIEAHFSVTGGRDEITVGLVGPSSDGGHYRFLREARSVAHGVIRYPATEFGEYQVLVDNRGQKEHPVAVQLSIDLIFNEPGTLRPALVSPARRRVVVGSSLAFFLLICLWSGRRVVLSFRRRV